MDRENFIFFLTFVEHLGPIRRISGVVENTGKMFALNLKSVKYPPLTSYA
jgi:hypothetical protein